MDTTDLAAAAQHPEGRGRCNCARRTKDHKPSRSCPKCKGKGWFNACLDCGGSGWNPIENAACRRCGGRGYHLPPTPT